MDVDVLARENRRLDPERRGPRLDEAHRRLDRFLHHFAKLAGGLDIALAGNGDGLDRQQFAADLGPGEPGDRADLILFLAHAIAEAPHAEIFAEIILAHDDARIFGLEDVAERLAGDLGKLALERPDAGLAGVIAKDRAQAFVAELELAGFE